MVSALPWFRPYHGLSLNQMQKSEVSNRCRGSSACTDVIVSHTLLSGVHVALEDVTQGYLIR